MTAARAYRWASEPEMRDWMLGHAGAPARVDDVRRSFEARFGSPLSREQVSHFRARYGLARRKPACSAAHWHTLPVGTEREKRAGYVLVKVRRQPAPKRDRARRVALAAADARAVAAKLAARPADPPDAPLVTVDGSLVRPSELGRAFRAVCEDAGMPGWVRFHSLRHTHATLLILGRSDVRTVQDRLGHASAGTTLDTYSHVWPASGAEAAEAFRRAVGGLPTP